MRCAEPWAHASARRHAWRGLAVRALRAAGHDVGALAEEASRTVDAEVIAHAGREDQILLTEDEGFGWLAFVGGAGAAGVEP